MQSYLCTFVEDVCILGLPRGGKTQQGAFDWGRVQTYRTHLDLLEYSKEQSIDPGWQPLHYQVTYKVRTKSAIHKISWKNMVIMPRNTATISSSYWERGNIFRHDHGMILSWRSCFSTSGKYFRMIFLVFIGRAVIDSRITHYFWYTLILIKLVQQIYRKFNLY